jgi:hypothetical protein
MNILKIPLNPPLKKGEKLGEYPLYPKGHKYPEGHKEKGEVKQSSSPLKKGDLNNLNLFLVPSFSKGGLGWIL